MDEWVYGCDLLDEGLREWAHTKNHGPIWGTHEEACYRRGALGCRGVLLKAGVDAVKAEWPYGFDRSSLSDHSG